MSDPNEEKKFVIQHVFKDYKALKKNEYHYGATEMHHGVPWKVGVLETTNYLSLHLICEKHHGSEEWCISTNIRINVNNQQEESDKFSLKRVFNQSYHSNNYLKDFPIQAANKYIVDGDLTLKFDVQIQKMEGIKGKLRNFDKESAEKFSDVVLVVQNEKFYVNKMYLSQHTTYFEALFLGKFSESEKSEIELKDIEPWDFQNFLEVLYGEPAMDDDTVDGILNLADMYSTPTATRRCLKFLLKRSEKSLEEKFQLATKYNKVELVKKCVADMKTPADVRSVKPSDPADLEAWIWNELLEKALSLQSN